ncbi:MAG: OsmC family protein [Bacteroidales bacterium]|jgi:uncharacterized OsmC-like protein|nr:OsmC family protein [Bacteroidales bacterium]
MSEVIKTVYLGNLRTEAEHVRSKSKLLTDAPLDNHGKGEGFSPTDLFAASYASCALTIIGIAAQTHNFNIDGATVQTTKIMAENPRRIAEFVVEFTFPNNNYTQKERSIIENSIQNCPIGNTIANVVKITKTMNYEKS